MVGAGVEALSEIFDRIDEARLVYRLPGTRAGQQKLCKFVHKRRLWAHRLGPFAPNIFLSSAEKMAGLKHPLDSNNYKSWLFYRQTC